MRVVYALPSKMSALFVGDDVEWESGVDDDTGTRSTILMSAALFRKDGRGLQLSILRPSHPSATDTRVIVTKRGRVDFSAP